MLYQWLYRYSSHIVDGLSQIDRSIQGQAFLWEYFCIALPDKLGLFPMSFCYTRSFLSSYPGSAAICNTDGKANIEEEEEEEVKGTYIWLSCTLAVLTSAVSGNIRESVAAAADVIY